MGIGNSIFRMMPGWFAQRPPMVCLKKWVALAMVEPNRDSSVKNQGDHRQKVQALGVSPRVALLGKVADWEMVLVMEVRGMDPPVFLGDLVHWRVIGARADLQVPGNRGPLDMERVEMGLKAIQRIRTKFPA
jgi:hypothetical protein